jgi:hypothetical protein
LPAVGHVEIASITIRDLKAIIDRMVAKNALIFVRDVLSYYGIVVRHYNGYSDAPVFDHSVALRLYGLRLSRRFKVGL